jgi:hypothetical protein
MQKAAICFLYLISFCSNLIASGKLFQTVAIAARRVMDDAYLMMMMISLYKVVMSGAEELTYLVDVKNNLSNFWKFWNSPIQDLGIC